jgi:uncharacterized protein (DUF1778 family)
MSLLTELLGLRYSRPTNIVPLSEAIRIWHRFCLRFEECLNFGLCAILVHIFQMPPTLIKPKSQKKERLVARVLFEDKAIISQAAAIAGQSVGSFMLAEARKAAIQTLEMRQRILLNAAQSRRLVEALLAPPLPPTERMKRALKLYRETVLSDVNA